MDILQRLEGGSAEVVPLSGHGDNRLLVHHSGLFRLSVMKPQDWIPDGVRLRVDPVVILAGL